MVFHVHPLQLLSEISFIWRTLYQNFERPVNCRLQGEELLPVEYSMFAFGLQSFHSTEKIAQLALQESEPRFDILAIRFPIGDYEQSNVHAHVPTAEFPTNVRARQICLSYTDSDDAILQQETETTHVSNVQLLYLQTVGLGLLVELQTSGINTLLMFLQMRVIVPLDALKFSRCFTAQTYLFLCCIACDNSIT